MSEHQHYEFIALDRPLSADDQRELREISSRAQITSGSFVNTYDWGDLRGDPEQMLARWFDAFLYVSNFGSHRLSFRLPSGTLAPETLAPYAQGALSLDVGLRTLCVHFRREDEDPSGWFDTEGLLGRLLPLREALMSDDQRSLYLAWLRDAQMGHLAADTREPPLPPGLGQRDAALEAFVELMGLDEDLLAAAAEPSPPRNVPVPGRETVLAWLGSRPAQEKDEWLLRAFDGDGAKLGRELVRRFAEDHPPPRPSTRALRTVAALRSRARDLAVERQARAQQERQQQAAERERARQQHLDSLVGREEEIWSQVDALVAEKRPTAYERAVTLLADLRDLAIREGKPEPWAVRLAALRRANTTKRSLLRQLDTLGGGRRR